MLKRWIFLFAVPAVLCAALPACGGGSGGDDATAVSNAQEPDGVTTRAPSGLRAAP